jgi:hypothetical protein
LKSTRQYWSYATVAPGTAVGVAAAAGEAAVASVADAATASVTAASLVLTRLRMLPPRDEIHSLQ